jgi:hypothetical protein
MKIQDYSLYDSLQSISPGIWGAIGLSLPASPKWAYDVKKDHGKPKQK